MNLFLKNTSRMPLKSITDDTRTQYESLKITETKGAHTYPSVIRLIFHPIPIIVWSSSNHIHDYSR